MVAGLYTLLSFLFLLFVCLYVFKYNIMTSLFKVTYLDKMYNDFCGQWVIKCNSLVRL